jgi:lysine-specific demethylase 8
MDIQGTVRRSSNMSASDFHEHVRNAGGPIVLANSMSHWNALSAWSNEYLRERCAGRSLRVVVEENGHNRYDRATPTYIDAEDYINTLTNDDAAGKRISAVQVPILDQLPDLLGDIDWPSVIHAREVVSLNYWMAARGTVTHLHWDGNPGLLALVRGRKKMTLFSPEQYELFYPVTSSEPWLIWSQVDTFAPDYKRFPKLKLARGIEVVLEVGDILYVPPHWWHFVENLETSIGVQFWLVPSDAIAKEVGNGHTFYDDRTRIAQIRPKK